VKSLLKVSKALADETRLRIINVLFARESCLCELQEIFNMSEPRISRHLRILKEADLIDQRKEGKWNFSRPNTTDSNMLLFKYLRYQFDLDSLFLKDIERSKKVKVECSL